MTARVVLCMKWGRLYGPDYVNVLFRAVAAHLDAPARFVCLTDDPAGIDPAVETFPIPDMGLDASYFDIGGWPKIAAFKPDLYDIRGRVLFADLDMMILGSLEPFFAQPGAFVAIGSSTWSAPPLRRKPWVYRKWKSLRARARAGRSAPAAGPTGPTAADAPAVGASGMGTGIFAFDAGALPQVWERFMADPAGARAGHINEQHFVENQLDRWSPWPEGWVTSFKYSLRQPLGLDLFREPRAPAAGCPVVAFHGDPRPRALALRRISSVRELPHMWIGPVSWVRDYWQHYLP